MAGRTKNLNVCGLSVPFDGAPRLEEIEAYVAIFSTVPEGVILAGQIAHAVKTMVPAVINARLRPSVAFILDPHAVIDAATIEGVTAVINAVRETLDDPKLKAALGIQIAPPNGNP